MMAFLISIIHIFCHPWSHQHRTGAWHYYQCAGCSRRMAERIVGLRGPVDYEWLLEPDEHGNISATVVIHD